MIKLNNNGWRIIILTLILSIVGLIMVYSASKEWANFKYGDPFYFAQRQGIFVFIGVILMMAVARIPIDYWKKHVRTILIISFGLLILVIVPGIGIERNGSQSWFGIGTFAIQPAEVFKLAMVIFASVQLSNNYRSTRFFFKGILPIMIPSLLGFLLIMLQPDLGTGVVIIGAIMLMTMVSRASIKNYIYLGLLGVLAFGLLILAAPYRLTRIIAFINPWEDPLGSGFQIIQSLYAIGPGGLLGLGLDNSIQKHFFLPEPQTDFIFAIISEEMGFIGATVILAIFALFINTGLQIALKQNTMYRSFLAIGITSLIGVQTLINLAVVVGLLPVTGITLPFISYGGSSLVISLIASGILAGCDQKEEVHL